MKKTLKELASEAIVTVGAGVLVGCGVALGFFAVCALLIR